MNRSPIALFAALFVAGLAVAGVALITDSFWFLLGSVALIGLAALGLFVQGWRAAAIADARLSFVAVLTGSLVAAGLGVAAIVTGVRGDAPGLALFGIAVVVADLIAVLTVGMRSAVGRG